MIANMDKSKSFFMFHESVINDYDAWFTKKNFHLSILCFLTQSFKDTA